MSTNRPLIYGVDPTPGDILRLASLHVPGTNEGEAFTCFFRMPLFGQSEPVAMRDSTRLSITCACHPETRLARYEQRPIHKKGFGLCSVIVFDDNSEMERSELRMAHAQVHAKVLSVHRG